MILGCADCQQTYPLNTRHWHCRCGGVFELKDGPGFARDKIQTREPSLWRYRAMLPLDRDEHIVSLGEGFTPLVETDIYGLKIHCKVEFLSPTGSFKDRGTAVLISVLKGLDVKTIVDDSSGNAGASLAAYAARAGMACEIYVPASASLPKRAQIAIYGARLIKVEGPRREAALAAQEAATRGPYYASHYYNPFTLQGLKTMAYEIWEQLGGRGPDNLVLPAGHGTLLLGAYRGFTDLLEAGLIGRLPRLFAVQASACAPLYGAYRQGADEVSPVKEDETLAEGIRVPHPVRGKQILAAIRQTGGAVLAVDDERIGQAQQELAQGGFYVEFTSAAPVAALKELHDTITADQITVVPLTGSGFKSP
ncbi:MAG TPA: pyridoxal-phosphate dependent enzyme [Anaerolineae bacterium]|nr:pyridoxal-phosphate dependent enzyme [Anaerolineae bacterium]